MATSTLARSLSAQIAFSAGDFALAQLKEGAEAAQPGADNSRQAVADSRGGRGGTGFHRLDPEHDERKLRSSAKEAGGVKRSPARLFPTKQLQTPMPVGRGEMKCLPEVEYPDKFHGWASPVGLHERLISCSVRRL